MNSSPRLGLLRPPLLVPLVLLQSVLLVGCGGSTSGQAAATTDPSPNTEVSGSTNADDADQWRLVWQDEFDQDQVDPAKWQHEVNCWGGGNNELQCYTALEQNAFVVDGRLHIVARKQAWQGPAVHAEAAGYDLQDRSGSGEYTSARLRTRHLADWRYGRFEIRAKMPQGQGVWPALWMLPSHNHYGSWPLSGEIDIFEAINTNASDGNEMHGTLHYGLPWPDNAHTGVAYTPSANIWETFHTYAVEWEEGEIRWFVDDVHYATQTDELWFTYTQTDSGEFQRASGAAPFDQPFHLIMNVAVGGNWPGDPNAETRFPQEMVVDYVRVYECTADPATGRGCRQNASAAVKPLER